MSSEEYAGSKTTKKRSREKTPRESLGSNRISTTLESHEQKLMIFVAMEYDAGASLHLSTCQSNFM
jgi:hypothetical protein